MIEKILAPYGSWKSPITADLIVGGSIILGGTLADGEDLYWTELRPADAGRVVVVRREPGGRISDVTPAGFNARTRVHEYGGGAFIPSQGEVWFSHFPDQRLYRQGAGTAPRPVTEAVDRRYADAVVDRRRGLLYAVREDHADTSRGAINTIVRMELDGEDESVVVEGHDFYSNPRVSPDGLHLAWLAWNHPHLPWDGTELWTADLDGSGAPRAARRVSAGEEDAIYQPEWSPSGLLHFVSDRSGWWNLYRLEGERAIPLAAMEAEFGSAQWTLRQSNYAFTASGRLVAVANGGGQTGLGIVENGAFRKVETGYEAFSSITTIGEDVFCVAAAPDQPPAVVRIPVGGGAPETIRLCLTGDFDPRYLSSPQPIEFPTEGGKTAHAIFYPPTNPDYEAPPGAKPPLVVHSHGGPTSAYSTSFNLHTQFYTSRGIAIVEVNYGGSTGHGTAYRRRLNGQWGVVDVDDCINAARYLVTRGLADENRVAVSGGSAGGYTTLAALTMRSYFGAGANHFGLSDLIPFAKDTHKFESRYLDTLIGPYPEREDLYRERSPLTHVDNLDCPLIVFQGLEDRVVPPNQSELIVEAARRKGLPVAYLAFEGEQHGFRQARNIKRSLEGELSFYSQVFDFGLGETIEPVVIENL